jgi:hypothetical protein
MLNTEYRARRAYAAGDIPKVTETQHQQALYGWWKVYARVHGYPARAFVHIPNEAKRSVKVAAILKSEGMQPGIPDIFLAIPRAPYAGLWIELKAKQGKPSDAQKEYVSLLNKGGYKAVLCYGWESARETIETYLSEAESALKTQM